MKHRKTLTRILLQTPAIGLSTVVGSVMMLLNLLSPALFRIMVDYVVPMRSESGFIVVSLFVCITLVAIAALRSALRLLQGEARDALEIYFLKAKCRKEAALLDAGNLAAIEQLAHIPLTSYRAAAELLGQEPSQVAAGFCFIVAGGAALAVTSGPVSVLLLTLVFVLKIVDLWLASREQNFAVSIWESHGELQSKMASFHSSAKSLFGLQTGGLLLTQLNGALSDLSTHTGRLRLKQFSNDVLINTSAELAYGLSFLFAGFQVLKGQLSFGQFVFVVTMLLQVQVPIMMVLNSFLALLRMRPVLEQITDRLFDDTTREISGYVAKNPVSKPILPTQLIVTGVSGAGKTTLIEQWYREWNVAGTRKMTYVPQNISLYPCPTNDYFPIDADPARRLAVIKALGLERVVENNIRADLLSGGEKRRLLIARSLLLEPKVMILDEPESGLDAVSRSHLRSCLDDYMKMVDTSIILVSHDPEFVKMLSQRLDISAEEGGQSYAS